ncbi:hypothetical protein [Nonomuraea rubra]|uniref:hypothetical protein n=1 Tax=Nonomuraea rubra TaxID=46180 RepID=UPI003CD09E4C
MVNVDHHRLHRRLCTATRTRRSWWRGRRESRLLVERTREAMMRAIRAVAPGRQLQRVGSVIEALRTSASARRGARLHRPRDRHELPLGLMVPHYRRHRRCGWSWCRG